LKQTHWWYAVLLGALFFSSIGHARDFGVSVPPIHKGKFTSSLLYEYLKVHEDFDSRGRSDFKSQVVGSQFTYGITDVLAVGIKGGVLVDPQVDAQGSQWESRAGYLYGVDLYNEIFPATGYRPGIMGSIGATGFQAPLDRVMDPSGVTTSVDQVMSGIDYHASLLLAMKWNRFSPYTGVRLFGRSVNWQDNQSAMTGSPDHIGGHAHGNASVVVGIPFRITQDIQFHAEAILINETAYTAGFTIAAF
jgi:hypothetical protein